MQPIEYIVGLSQWHSVEQLICLVGRLDELHYSQHATNKLYLALSSVKE
jgi:hypothetical protein